MTIKNRFWGRPNSIEEEIDLRKITKKDKWDREIKKERRRNRNKRDGRRW